MKKIFSTNFSAKLVSTFLIVAILMVSCDKQVAGPKAVSSNVSEMGKNKVPPPIHVDTTKLH